MGAVTIGCHSSVHMLQICGCYNPLSPIIIINLYYACFVQFCILLHTQSSGDVSNPTKESETDGSQPHSRLFVPSKSSDSSIRLRLIGTSQSKEEPRYGAGVFTYTSDHEEQRNNETTDNCKSI